jgi:hypothetical protein
MWLTLFLLLVPALASATTYDLTAATTSVTITGTFTLDGSIVADYNFTTLSTWDALPSSTFTVANATATYCNGLCVFGSPAGQTLQLWNDAGLTLRFSFDDAWTYRDRSGWYRFTDSVPLSLVQSASVVSTTPELSSFVLLLIALLPFAYKKAPLGM